MKYWTILSLKIQLNYKNWFWKEKSSWVMSSHFNQEHMPHQFLIIHEHGKIQKKGTMARRFFQLLWVFWGHKTQSNVHTHTYTYPFKLAIWNQQNPKQGNFDKFNQLWQNGIKWCSHFTLCARDNCSKVQWSYQLPKLLLSLID